MMTPKQATFYELESEEFFALMKERLPTIDTYFFTQEGGHSYAVDVTDDITEVEEWRKELMEATKYCAASLALEDYLSLLCYDKVIPPGQYLVHVFW